MSEPRNPSLNIATWHERSIANGPGERFVIWVQGCPFRCPGCFNQDFLTFSERQRLAPTEIASMVLAVQGIEGVTYSGGEPMAQAEALCEASRLLRDSGLSVMCYTGYTLEQLQNSRNVWVHSFIEQIDILVDGVYQAADQALLPWRGSRNQRVHFLTDRYRDLEHTVNEPHASVELLIGNDGFVATGVISEELLIQLIHILRQPVNEVSSALDSLSKSPILKVGGEFK